MKSAIDNYFNNSGTYAWFEVCLYLFMVSLPMGYGLDAILIVPMAISWWFISDWSEKSEHLKRNRTSLAIIYGLYVLFLLGLFYSDSFKIAIGRVERGLALLILPLIIFSIDTLIFRLKRIFCALGVGLFITMAVSWCAIAIDIVSKPWPLRQLRYFFEWIYTDDNLLLAMDIHPGYFVLFLVLFLAAMITDPIFIQLRHKKMAFVLSLFLGLLFIVETSSRIGFLCLVLILIVASFKKTTLKTKGVYFGAIILLIFTASQFNYLESKFEKTIDLEGNIKFERYHRWKEILYVFCERDVWLFGVGNGDVNEIYQQAYKNGKFTLATQESYNAHNQYLELLVGTGVIGLAYYFVVLGHFILRTKLKGLSLAFMILIVLFSFSESFLVRSKGVFFFSFFYALFISKSNFYLEKSKI